MLGPPTNVLQNAATLQPYTVRAVDAGMKAIRAICVNNPSTGTTVLAYLGDDLNSTPIPFPPGSSVTQPIRPSPAVSFAFANPANDGTTLVLHADEQPLTASSTQVYLPPANAAKLISPKISTPQAFDSNGEWFSFGYTVPAGQNLYVTDFGYFVHSTAYASGNPMLCDINFQRDNFAAGAIDLPTRCTMQNGVGATAFFATPFETAIVIPSGKTPGLGCQTIVSGNDANIVGYFNGYVQ